MPKTTNTEPKLLFKSVWDVEDEATILVHKKFEDEKYWYRFNEEDEWKEMNSEYELTVESLSPTIGRYKTIYTQYNPQLLTFHCRETNHTIKVDCMVCGETKKYFYRTNVLNQWYEMVTRIKIKIGDDYYHLKE